MVIETDVLLEKIEEILGSENKKYKEIFEFVATMAVEENELPQCVELRKKCKSLEKNNKNWKRKVQRLRQGGIPVSPDSLPDAKTNNELRGMTKTQLIAYIRNLEYHCAEKERRQE